LSMCGIHPGAVVLPPPPRPSYSAPQKLNLGRILSVFAKNIELRRFTTFLLPCSLGSGFIFGLAKVRVRDNSRARVCEHILNCCYCIGLKSTSIN
jgi:hypothetical protein